MIPHIQSQPISNEETSSGLHPISSGSPSSVPMNNFRQVLDLRFTMLESLKGILSMRFYERILEKLKQEENKSLELTGAASDKQKRQQRYSHVLDPQYFEQRFL